MPKASDAIPIGIHWFRRDLRLAGNEALFENAGRNGGKVLGLFCFDAKFLARSDFSHNRFAFFIETLRSLREDMRSAGGDLLVVDGMYSDVFPRIVEYFAKNKKYKLSEVTFNRDYEPYARARDQKVEKILRDEGISFTTYRDHLIIEPEELNRGKPGEYYQVYSAFAKKWFDILHADDMKARITAQKNGLDYLFSKSKKKYFSLSWKEVAGSGFPCEDRLETFAKDNAKHVTIDIPDAGAPAIREALTVFKKKLASYKTDRDIPSVLGTSRFSIYFKNGSLTTAQAAQYLGLENISFKTENGPARFLKELVWREFYYHILYHRPDVENRAFLEKYKNIKWPNNKKWFERWCAGQTGFPIVDAGMRELNTTGWMHNRVRMIVSSFLIKDLLIDWRWGEKYFMEKLLDGDMAPNNGGWQWAASTGCDAQPYFRIFNPWLQSAKFDPDGEYIRRYVPELKKAPNKVLHKEDEDRTVYGYPEPIVTHAHQKTKALALYK